MKKEKFVTMARVVSDGQKFFVEEEGYYRDKEALEIRRILGKTEKDPEEKYFMKSGGFGAEAEAIEYLETRVTMISPDKMAAFRASLPDNE